MESKKGSNVGSKFSQSGPHTIMVKRIGGIDGALLGEREGVMLGSPVGTSLGLTVGSKLG